MFLKETLIFCEEFEGGQLEKIDYYLIYIAMLLWLIQLLELPAQTRVLLDEGCAEYSFDGVQNNSIVIFFILLPNLIFLIKFPKRSLPELQIVYFSIEVRQQRGSEIEESVLTLDEHNCMQVFDKFHVFNQLIPYSYNSIHELSRPDAQKIVGAL